MEPDVLQLIGFFVGLFLSFVMNLLMKKSWHNSIKFVIVIAVSAIVSVIQLAVAGKLDDYGAGNWLQLLVAIIMGSQVTFFAFINTVPGLKDWLYSHLLKDKPVLRP